MPITIHPASVTPEKFSLEGYRAPKSLGHLFDTSLARNAEAKAQENWSFTDADSKDQPPPYEDKCLRVQLSSEGGENVKMTRVPNGLVHAMSAAYNEHRHLVLRPDDVWHGLLTQFSLYVQANAETLRGKFVAHEGKKELKVTSVGNIATADFGAMAQEMGRLLEENVKDPELRKWLIPTFSTTTNNDTTIASVVMMATLQQYFSFTFGLTCGLPSVTLLGTREDWEALRAKVDKFAEFGSEPEQWTKLLQPVFDGFVKCFDESQVTQTKDFWSRICHYVGGGSGSTFLCGWATVFTVWNKEGKWQGDGWKKAPWNVDPGAEATYGRWPIIDTAKIAPGSVEVPVLVDDNGANHKTIMIAGLAAIRDSANAQGESTVEPVSGWAMFEVPEE